MPSGAEPIYPGDAPDSSPPPRFLTDPPAETSGSLAEEWIPWIESADDGPHMRLRPWQRLVLERALSVDSDGRLLFRTVVVSTPRQQGKGFLIYALAAARCHFASSLGDRQQVLHLANNLKAARRIHQMAWRWAQRTDGLKLYQGYGNERIIWPDESGWDLVAVPAIWGASANVAIADECWDLAPEVISSAVVPTMVEREQAQLWLLSTSNEQATALMPEYRGRAISGMPRMMIAEWSADEEADPMDPETWRSAAAYWGRERFEVMASERLTKGFRYQWLNRWEVGGSAGLRWGQVWSGLLRPERKAHVWRGPLVGSLESELGQTSWAAAVSDGEHVDVREFSRLGHAITWLRARSPELVLCHEAVAKRIEDGILPVAKLSSAEALAAKSAFQDAIPSLSWSGTLGARLPGVESNPGTDQIDPRRSPGPTASVKAATWAVWSVRVRPLVEAQIW